MIALVKGRMDVAGSTGVLASGQPALVEFILDLIRVERRDAKRDVPYGASALNASAATDEIPPMSPISH